MRENDNAQTRPPTPRKKKSKNRPRRPRRPGVAGSSGSSAGAWPACSVLGLAIWGLFSLFGGPGGVFGAVIAKARPAEKKPDEVTHAFPLGSGPRGRGREWKVTPDGLPPASGLTSAVPLPDGNLIGVLFADPARGTAAVLTTRPPPGRARPSPSISGRPTRATGSRSISRAGRVVGQTTVEGVRGGFASTPAGCDERRASARPRANGWRSPSPATG